MKMPVQVPFRRAMASLACAFGLSIVSMASLVVVASPVQASFHVSLIDEVMTGLNGSTDVQFVEIRMLTPDQHFVGGTELAAFDASGNFLRTVLTVPNNVQGGIDRRWLMASQNFQGNLGFQPDFQFPTGPGLGLEQNDGMVCWGKPADQTDPDDYIDCLAYGNYTGPTNHHIGTPTPISPNGRSLQRVDETEDSFTDFACADVATPERNDGQTGNQPASESCPVCGNNTDEQGEQCDGTDDSLCPGVCNPDCTCGNTCGNNLVEPNEVCDGTDAQACSADCQSNCTCAAPGVLDKTDQKCALSYLKGSAKVLGTYGKTVSLCMKFFGIGITQDDPFTCTAADEKGKILKAEDKLDDIVADLCGSPWAVDCPVPCDATDADGVSESVDDGTELAACLRCMNKATVVGDDAEVSDGIHDLAMEGATLATLSSDKDVFKCQTGVIKTMDKLFAIRVKGLATCAKVELKTNQPTFGAACVGTDPRGKAAKIEAKLAKVVDSCGGAVVFDAGACAGMSGATLTQCLATNVSCRACQWGNTVMGSSVDCVAVAGCS